MPEVPIRHFLPALMGSLHQQKAGGQLVLEQNDGTRRLFWEDGDLRHLRSEVVGEQFGNFLIRRGVLDMAALKELLSDGEGTRVGERLVEWGLMTQQERDKWLHELMGSVLLHAMEHPILKMTWLPGSLGDLLSGDIEFRLDQHGLIWDAFQNANIEQELVDMFRSEPDWRWQAPPNLLEALSSLPLTPTLAYALSMLGTAPLGYDTISALMGLSQAKTAQLVATLWALGGLKLVRGQLPLLPRTEPPKPVTAPVPEPEVEITLVEEDPHDSLEVPEAPLHRAPKAPSPITLMDILEMDVPPSGRDPHSPAGPPPARDPFSPAGPPPVPPPISPLSSQSAIETFPLSEPFSPYDSVSTPSDPLPPLPGEENLPPVERARQLLVKAKSYLLQNRASEAIRALEQAIKLDGDSPGAFETWLLLGRLRLSNPAWSTRAIEALQVASRLNPRAAEPWALMGELYLRKGFKANAQGCFRRALDLDPSVAVPAGWSQETSTPPAPKESPNGLVGKLRGMFGREKG